MTASESARAFAALSESEQEQRISDVATMLEDKCRGMYIRANVKNLAKDLLETGHVDDFIVLNGDFRTVWSLWNRGVDVDTVFALISLDPNLEPMRFEYYRGGDDSNYKFLNFKFSYDGFTSIFRSGGSETFKRAIHKYLLKYGGSSTTNKIYPCTDYLIYAAVILMRKYGEEKIIALLDRTVQESPLPVLDFIRLVSSDQDFSNLPLEWATKMVVNVND